jgi:hypothetical protein
MLAVLDRPAGPCVLGSPGVTIALDIHVRVVTLRLLIRLKWAAGRPQCG